MIIDKDTAGNISITELTPQQAEGIRVALLHLTEVQPQKTELHVFLTSLAIQIDKLTPQTNEK